jgi:hypothetical protein
MKTIADTMTIDELQTGRITKAERTLARLYHDPKWATAGQLAQAAQMCEADPELAAARDVIMAGRAAVTAVTDPALFARLNRILIHERPAQERLHARLGLTGSELAGDFWPDDKPVMVAAFETAGTGEWPKAPERVDMASEPIGSHGNLIPGPKTTKVKIGYRWRRMWETDPREYYFRARREAEKVHAEMAYSSMYWHDMESEADVVRFVNARRMAEKRANKKGQPVTEHVYCHYPYVGDDDIHHVIVSNYAAEAAGRVPTDRAAALRLFHEWVNTPEDATLNRKSNRYGRQWQGMKGLGSVKYAKQTAAVASGDNDNGAPAVPSVQLVTKMLPDDLLRAIGRTQFEFEIDNEDMPALFRLLRERVPDLKMRGGGNPETAWRMACTHVGDTRQIDKKVSPTWVQEPFEPMSETPEEALNAIFGGPTT